MYRCDPATHLLNWPLYTHTQLVPYPYLCKYPVQNVGETTQKIENNSQAWAQQTRISKTQSTIQTHIIRPCLKPTTGERHRPLFLSLSLQVAFISWILQITSMRFWFYRKSQTSVLLVLPFSSPAFCFLFFFPPTFNIFCAKNKSICFPFGFSM